MMDGWICVNAAWLPVLKSNVYVRVVCVQTDTPAGAAKHHLGDIRESLWAMLHDAYVAFDFPVLKSCTHSSASKDKPQIWEKKFD